MELDLIRADLLQLDPFSNAGTMALLPRGKKGKQKLVVGDDSGTLACYEFKKGEPLVVFTLRAFQTPVSAVTVGGLTVKTDKIFAASGQHIIGVTKKGKEFFRLTSSLTEPIRHIVVEEAKIWSTCEFIYNVYDNGQDFAFFMASDVIHAVAVDDITGGSEKDAILACQDNRLRVVTGSALSYEIRSSGPVTSVVAMPGGESRRQRGTVGVLYGQDNGLLSHIETGATGTNTIWKIEDGIKKSRITCIALFDIMRDGEAQIIIGRDDGRVEIFASERHGRGVPQKIFSRDLGECIKSIDAGFISSTEFPELVIGTFSGKVVSFTTEPIQARAVEDTYGRSVQTLNDENRIKQLRKEIADIQAQVDKDTAKLKSATKGGSTTVPLVKDFPVSCKFALDLDLGAFQLQVEIQTSIDLVLVTSPVPLTMVDTETSGSTIASFSSVAETSMSDSKLNKFVATFRCQASDSRRMTAAIRTNEGEFGDIVVTIVVAGAPKAAKVIRFPLKPLSIHTRVHDFSSDEASRPRHTLEYRVTATISTIHEWLTTIFPEMPPHIDETAVKEYLNFRNVFTGGICHVVYMRDSLIIESDSASVIAIVKEHIGRIGTSRRIQLNESVSMSDDACISFLDLVLPKLAYQVQLTRRFHLIETIAEITMQEDDIRWLSDEYASILRDQDKIRREFKDRANNMQFLIGILNDLFIDWCKLVGADGRILLGELNAALAAGDLHRVKDLFVSCRK